MVSLIDCGHAEPVRKHRYIPENLKLTQPIPVTLHPASVYLSGLSEGSRRTIRYSLNTIASLLTNGDCDADTCLLV